MAVGYVIERGSLSTCREPGCSGPHATRGLCMPHYNKLRRDGNLQARPELVYCSGCDAEIEVAPKGPIPSLCQACKAKRRKRQTHEHHRRTILKRRGISEDEYLEMYGEQNGRCAICDSPPNHGNGARYGRLSIDHDHETGRVRGLLCSRCNSGLGMFLDDPTICLEAHDYLSYGPRQWRHMRKAS